LHPVFSSTRRIIRAMPGWGTAPLPRNGSTPATSPRASANSIVKAMAVAGYDAEEIAERLATSKLFRSEADLRAQIENWITDRPFAGSPCPFIAPPNALTSQVAAASSSPERTPGATLFGLPPSYARRRRHRCHLGQVTDCVVVFRFLVCGEFIEWDEQSVNPLFRLELLGPLLFPVLRQAGKSLLGVDVTPSIVQMKFHPQVVFFFREFFEMKL